MRAEFVVRYEGRSADQHLLPAYEGAVSIQGISRSLTLITTYLATGKIRKNAPFESPIQLFLKPSQPGSFETIYQIVSDFPVETVIDGVALSVTGDLIYDTVKVVFNRVTGKAAKPQQKKLEELLQKKGGDFAALEDAVEPSIVMAHKVIGTGSNNIVIFGDNNKITFNGTTKDFVTAHIQDEVTEKKDVSVASYNANSKSGRVFDFEFERTVPFTIASAASKSTAVAIAWGLARYTRGEDSRVAITYNKILAPDGRVKKYIVKSAKRVKEDA